MVHFMKEECKSS